MNRKEKLWQDRALIFWGAGAVLAGAALEWALIETALRAAGQHPLARCAWFFPLVLFPILLAVMVINFRSTTSRQARRLLLKYLTLYLPSVWVPLATSLYGSGKWQLMAWAVAVPVQIWLPFRHSKKIRLLEKQEREVAAV